MYIVRGMSVFLKPLKWPTCASGTYAHYYSY